MNVELRIAHLEQMLGKVSQRRASCQVAVPAEFRAKTPVEGWTGLEHEFRAALTSAERLRASPESGFAS